jgi:hypothetical protein
MRHPREFDGGVFRSSTPSTRTNIKQISSWREMNPRNVAFIRQKDDPPVVAYQLPTIGRRFQRTPSPPPPHHTEMRGLVAPSPPRTRPCASLAGIAIAKVTEENRSRHLASISASPSEPPICISMRSLRVGMKGPRHHSSPEEMKARCRR